MDTIKLPDCQVGWSHSIETFKSTCTDILLITLQLNQQCWWFFFQKHSKMFNAFRSESCFLRSRKTRKMLWIMLPCFPAGARTQEMGSKKKGKRGKEEFLEGKCYKGWSGCGHGRRQLQWWRGGWKRRKMDIMFVIFSCRSCFPFVIRFSVTVGEAATFFLIGFLGSFHWSVHVANTKLQHTQICDTNFSNAQQSPKSLKHICAHPCDTQWLPVLMQQKRRLSWTALTPWATPQT